MSMTWSDFGIDKEDDIKLVRATFIFLKRVGMLQDDTFIGLVKRFESRNTFLAENTTNGKNVCGLVKFMPEAYLQRELTDFLLKFVEEPQNIKNHYAYKKITREDRLLFYEKNRDLFTRADMEDFTFEEVEDIIQKRLREQEYNDNVANILCELC